MTPEPNGRGRVRLWRQRLIRPLAAWAVMVGAPLLLASNASAQDSTSTAETAAPRIGPPEARVDPAQSDTVETALVSPARPLAGRPVTPVPAVTMVLDAADLFGAPGLMTGLAYGLGTPARTAGLSLDGIAPDRLSLSLDGRPLADLFTGAPRLDLLPWEAADRLALADARGGSPLGLVAGLRPFRLRLPISELRYLPGESGLQVVSGTYAQTRGALLGLGGPRARMTTTVHVAGRQANGPVTGGKLRHAHAVARLAIAAPRWGAELTEFYSERTDGARRGLVLNDDLYDPLRASVLNASAERRTLRNEVAVAARLPLAGSQPLAAWASWTRQTTRYAPGTFGADTVSVAGNRIALGAMQRLGARGPAVRAWAALDDDPWGRFDPLGDGNGRVQLHAALTDTLRVAGFRLAAQAGGHVLTTGTASGEIGPALALRAERGGLHGAVSWTGAIPGRIETAGFSPEAAGVPASIATGVNVRSVASAQERTLHAEIGARGQVGALSLGVRALGQIVTDAARLVVLEDVSTAAPEGVAFGYDRAAGAWTHLGARGHLGWRESASGGLYSTASLALTRWGGDDPLARRVGEATPLAYGSGRLGYRARRVGTGTAALDMGATVRAWSAFRGVRVHPATGLLALAQEDAPRLPARPVLDLDANVTFGTRATVGIRWENVLSGLLYDGAALVQGEPLAASQLRFGVFWALTE